MLHRLARILRARASGHRPESGSSRGLARPWLLLLVIGVACLALFRVASSSDDPLESDADGKPRAILNRPWFDRFPEKPTEDVHLWIWFGGGIAVHEHGSRYKASVEIFDFERSGDKLDIRSLHDGRRTKTAFTVKSCDDRPPFDVCLDLEASPSGPKRLYSFGGEDDLAEHIPWALQARRAAEERARAPRP